MESTNNANTNQQEQQPDAATESVTSTYDIVVDLADRVLKKSRKSLNTRELIEATYQEHQKAIVGPDALQKILNDKLDDMINDDDTGKYCCDHRASENGATAKESMDSIDDIIQFVTEWEARRDQAETMDVASAKQSLETTLLPKGVSTQDVKNYFEHQKRLQMQQALQAELEKTEQEVAALQQAKAHKEAAQQMKLAQVDKVEGNLEAAANMCAMVSNCDALRAQVGC
ncbi:MAG: hypothetical protein SGARI_005539 [Bacillariaceae sp.]